MTFYPTTLLPPSLPYESIETIIMVLCDRCLALTEDIDAPHLEKQQLFDLTMSLVDFWEKREETHKYALR